MESNVLKSYSGYHGENKQKHDIYKMEKKMKSQHCTMKLSS